MARWVKFSERLPTESDADRDNHVITFFETEGLSTRDIHFLDFENREGWYWLENVPALPTKPKTIEDVARNFRKERQ